MFIKYIEPMLLFDWNLIAVRIRTLDQGESGDGVAGGGIAVNPFILV
jgi:hypothetical protein